MIVSTRLALACALTMTVVGPRAAWSDRVAPLAFSQTAPPPAADDATPPPVAPAAGGLGANRLAGTAQTGRAGQAPPAVTVAQAEQLFDRVMLNQARRVLALDPEQFERFRPRLVRLQTIRRRTERERALLVRELAQLDSATPVDEATIAAKLDALKAFDAETTRQIQDAYAAIDETLTPVQQARFRVLEQRMARQEQDLIAAARARAATTPGRTP